MGTSVRNTAQGGNADALQNLASNNGHGILITGTSNQTVGGALGSVSNMASGSSARATQNLSSNFGKVTIAGVSNQSTYVAGGFVTNLALGRNSHAIQNIASNDACDEPQDPCPHGCR